MNLRGGRLLATSLSIAVGVTFGAFAATVEIGPPGALAAADELLKTGELDRAAELYGRILETQPDHVEALVGRCRALLAAQRWREALREAGAALDRQPQSAALAVVRGEALFRAGRFEELDALLTPLVESAAPPARAQMLLGRLREAEGRDGEAVELMQAAVQAAPEDRDVLYWASGATETRAAAAALLERYLELSDGDDPDRIEAARGSIKVYRALGETPIWISEQRPERLELPLNPIWDPLGGQVIGYVVQARIGAKSKPVPLLLDTGSPGLYLIERVARKRGFSTLAEKTAFGGGGDRRHRTERGMFESISFGELRYSAALATTSRGEMDPTGRFHGLIGVSAFGGYRVTLDFPGRQLRLDPSDGTAKGSSPFWTVLGQLLVRVQLAPEVSGLFLLDSGATRTLVARSWAEELPGARLGGAVDIRGFGGGLQGARSLDGVEIVFQDRRTAHLELRAIDLSVRSKMAGVEIAGFLGLDFLSRSRVELDPDARSVRLLAAERD